MPRIRQIKPEYQLDDELAKLSRDTRLFFIYTWVIADKEGRLEYRSDKIKAMTFPYDDVDITKMIQDLVDSGFIIDYACKGKRYLQIRTFKKHQHCHVKEAESTIPAPDEHRTRTKKAPYKYGASTVLVPYKYGERTLDNGVLSIEDGGLNIDIAAPAGDGDLAAPKPDRKPRSPDLHWEALASWMGCKPETDSERGAWNKALKQLKQAGATPEDILRRGTWYEQTYLGIQKTPTGLVKHWGELANGPRVPTRSDQDQTPENKGMSSEEFRAFMKLGDKYARIRN